MQSSKLNKQFTLLLIIMPILNIYATHFVSALRLGELIGIVYMMYLFAMNSKIKLTNKIYWLAMFYLICISLILTMIINKYSLSDTMVRICRVLFYTYFAFALAPQYWNHKYGAKCYINMSLITSLFVIVQYLILQIFNMYIPFVLPGMNLSTNHPNSASYYKTLQRDFYWYGKSTRPSGLFLEPAHFCEFAVFALIFLIYKNNKNKIDYLKLIIITFAIAISRSSIGFFSLIIIYVLWGIQIFKKKIITKKAFFVSTFMIAIILMGIVKFDLLSAALWRLSTVMDDSIATTGNLRLLRGFIVYGKLPILYQIFGIGIGNYEAFINTYNITTFFDSTLNRTNEFMNTISVILVSGGIIGLFIYIISLFNIYIKADKAQKMIFAVFAVILLVSNNFYKETYMLTLVFMTINNGSDGEIYAR